MEIVAGVHSLPVATPGDFFLRRFPPNVYLVSDGEGALIDSGYDNEAAVRSRLDYLQNLPGLKLSYIVVTHHHPDHVGGAQRIKEATGAKVIIHSLDVSRAKETLKGIAIDRVLEDGDTLKIGNTRLEFVHTPGHTMGHVCIFDRERGFLFTGDHILGAGTTAVNPPDGDMALYMDSLKKLLSLDIKVIFPGHGESIKEPHRKIEELLQHRRERERQVLAYLEQGARTPEELLGLIYPELHQDLHDMAKGQMISHLIKLEREGKAEALKDGKGYRAK